VTELHRRLAPTSALVVPIVHDTRVLGALSLCYSHSGRAYAARHVAAAERLAARIARSLFPAPPITTLLDPHARGVQVRRRLPIRH
jgi:GAF domain-containing protein